MKNTALVFVHGWLGNSHWWDEQAKYFSSQYTITQLDLPKHNIKSSTDYARAIVEAVDKISADEIILVGHSMSGSYALIASLEIPRTKAIIVVDTLKNLDQLPTPEVAEKVMFEEYRKDYKGAVENMLPKFLFSEHTPPEVQTRLKNEFLKYDGELAIELLRPLYQMDTLHFAKAVTVPVVAINSDYTPTDIESNKKYFKNYSMIEIKNCGHYPMLERPMEFNHKLEEALKLLS